MPNYTKESTLTRRHTKLSSHETPYSRNAAFTDGQTSCKYFSAEYQRQKPISIRFKEKKPNISMQKTKTLNRKT